MCRPTIHSWLLAIQQLALAAAMATTYFSWAHQSPPAKSPMYYMRACWGAHDKGRYHELCNNTGYLELCHMCEGTGGDPSGAPHPCPGCGGESYEPARIRRMVNHLSGMPWSINRLTRECKQCDNGKDERGATCRWCKGTKQVVACGVCEGALTDDKGQPCKACKATGMQLKRLRQSRRAASSAK